MPDPEVIAGLAADDLEEVRGAVRADDQDLRDIGVVLVQVIPVLRHIDCARNVFSRAPVLEGRLKDPEHRPRV